jgi:hypothetical protein
MTPWIDIIDWTGGYPFEVVQPEILIASFQAKGYLLSKFCSVGSKAGNNQYIFVRVKTPVKV